MGDEREDYQIEQLVPDGLVHCLIAPLQYFITAEFDLWKYIGWMPPNSRSQTSRPIPSDVIVSFRCIPNPRPAREASKHHH